MNKIRGLTELEQEMSADFAWRKKDLHSLKSMVMSRTDHNNRDLWIRAAITLLYAHWEGFIRKIGGFYLQFVSNQRLKHSELTSPFVAIAVRQLARDLNSEGASARWVAIVDFFRSEVDSRSNLPWKAGINAKSNLNSAVLHDIVVSLGLDYSRFATKANLLDERLLKNRNHIAHGQYLLVGMNDYLDLHEEIVGMMQEFYDQVDDAAFTGRFRK